MRSRSTDLGTRGHLLTPLSISRPGLIHRPGDGTWLRADGVVRPNSVSPRRLSFDHCRFVGGERRIVDQHAMQDHSKLARKRDLGLVLAGAGSQAHGPALECARPDRLCEDDVRRFIKSCAHDKEPRGHRDRRSWRSGRSHPSRQTGSASASGRNGRRLGGNA